MKSFWHKASKKDITEGGTNNIVTAGVITSKKKSLILVIVAVMLLAATGAGVYIFIKNRQVPPPSVVHADYLKPERVKDLYTVAGSIESYSTKSVTINGASYKIVTTTEYKFGPDFLPGNADDVKPGVEAQVTFDKNNNEVYSIWYGY